MQQKWKVGNLGYFEMDVWIIQSIQSSQMVLSKGYKIVKGENLKLFEINDKSSEVNAKFKELKQRVEAYTMKGLNYPGIYQAIYMYWENAMSNLHNGVLLNSNYHKATAFLDEIDKAIHYYNQSIIQGIPIFR